MASILYNGTSYGFRYQKGLFRGRPYKKFGFRTKEEAEIAQAEYIINVKKNPESQLKPERFEEVVNSFLKDGVRNGKSKWRVDGLRYNFKRWILPYFGANTLLTDIKPAHVTDFVHQQKQRNVTNSTIWHIVVDLGACFNWAIKQELLVYNPVKKADLRLIKDRRVVKMSMKPGLVDRAAEVLDGTDRVYFNTLRYSGLRMDEGNRLRWTDFDFDRGELLVPGTKTRDSKALLPLAPVVIKALLELKATSTSEYCFPGKSAQTLGQKIYRRTRLFERIEKRSGIKLTAKDLRDWFATTIIKTADIRTVSSLLRHSNIQTTSTYLRRVDDRMKAAVEDLGK